MFAPYVPQSGGPRREVSGTHNVASGSTRGLNKPTMVATMTEEEIENIMENFAKEDSYFKKTWSRIVVEKFLGKVRALLVLQYLLLVRNWWLTVRALVLALHFNVCADVRVLSPQGRSQRPIVEQSVRVLRARDTPASL